MARKFIVVRPTKAHIKDGCRFLDDECPLADCLKDKLNTEQVSVSTTTGLVTLNPMTGPTRLRLSPAALQWAKDFDDGVAVQPQTFRLEVLEER